MKTHAIIPIFIPHAGCPHDCVFCNQKAITARSAPPTLPDTVAQIERNLKTIKDNPSVKTVEIAFFGGSFTGIPLEEQSAYLEIAKSYKDRGLIDMIHMSTRPDYINREILDNLQRYDADVIELGVQSFDPDVLRMSARGHSPEIVHESAHLIKEYGFTLGIQLMIGLPGDSYEKCMYSVSETIRIAPQIARLYPTVVIEDTALYEMTKRGLYTPLSEHEAVMTTKDMYRALTDAGINVIRVGLKSTDIIRAEDGAVGAGSYHPAFRQLVEAELAKEDLEAQLKSLLPDCGGLSPAAAAAFPGVPAAFGSAGRAPAASHGRPAGTPPGEASPSAPGRRFRGAAAPRATVIFTSCPETFSNMIGNRKSNKLYFEKKYPGIRFLFKTDPALPRGRCRAALQSVSAVFATEPAAACGAKINNKLNAAAVEL